MRADNGRKVKPGIVELVEDGMLGLIDNRISELGRMGGVDPVAERSGQRVIKICRRAV
jgi:hypothetical protein